MRYSLLITYYYNRNNIYEIIKELKKYNKKNLEILIRNDNPKKDLKLNKQGLNIKIFNEKKKSIGEINSIRFLLQKAKGKYISILADDDLFSVKILNFLNKKKKFDAFIPLVVFNKKYLEKKNNFDIKKNNLYNLFLNKKIFLSGTVGTFFKKEKLLDAIKIIGIKKYLFDFFLLLIVLLNKNFKFIFSNYYLGFNNVHSSKISSGKIDLDIFLKDLKKLLIYLTPLTNSKAKINLVKYLLEDIYNILFRKIRNISIKKMIIIFNILKQLGYLKSFQANYFFIKFLIKVLIKLFYNFFR